MFRLAQSGRFLLPALGSFLRLGGPAHSSNFSGSFAMPFGAGHEGGELGVQSA